MSHITTYARHPVKQQTQLRKYNIPANDAKKTKQYTKKMYTSGMFTNIELRQWGNKSKDETDKKWTMAKAYFDSLYAKKHTHQEDVGATKSGF